MLAINFVAFGDKGQNPALASVARTLRQVFPHQSVFVSEPGKDFNDFIFLAANSPINLDSDRLSTQQIQWLKRRYILVDESKGFILTDNLNPLEHLQTRKAEHYRQTLVEWFGADLLIR